MIDWDNAPEWKDEMIPPVGCYCECKKYPDHKCKVVGHDAVTVNGVNVVVKLTPPKGLPFYDAFIPGMFRPIRTKEQRERDELVEVCKTEYENCFPRGLNFESLADAIIAAGYRKQERD